MNSIGLLFTVVCLWLQHSCNGKLLLKSWPKGDVLYTTLITGRTYLQCEVESDKPFTLKWYRNGTEVAKPTNVPYWFYEYKDGTGAIFYQFPYIPLSVLNGTEYECRASNDIDPDVSRKIKFISLSPNDLPVGYPRIKKSTGNRYHNVYYGSNLTFHCDAEGEGKLEYMWYFRNVPLGKELKGAKDDPLRYSLSSNNKILNIYNIGKIHQSATINCYAINKYGIAVAPYFTVKTKSRPVITTTLHPPMAPRIITGPANITVGGPEQWVEFHCKAIGYPDEIFYFWYHDGVTIKAGEPTGRISVVAMRTGNITCRPYNKVGYAKQSATAYLFVTPLPYRADPVSITDRSSHHLTIEIKPNHREYSWHKHIPITHAIIHYRPFVYGQSVETPHNQTKIPLSGPAPWEYVFGSLEPWTYVDFRVRLVNRYGVGNVSEWRHERTEWGPIIEPVRNLKATPLSAKSFKVEWENPAKTNGPLVGYDVYHTKRPNAELKFWIMDAVERDKKSLVVDWTYDRSFTEVAPVLYWKVQLVGLAGKGPFSETKVFKCLPGAPGFVTNVALEVLSPRSIKVTWSPTKEQGSGVIGHQVLYNRQDIPAMEENWKVYQTNESKLFTVVIKNLSPNRPYEVKVYPYSKESTGVPSQIVVAKTLPDAPTAPPQNVRGVAKHSQTLEIYWDPPLEEHQNSPITKYKLFYSLHDREPTVKELDKDARHVQLQGLGKYKKYKVWMVAYNKIGVSPPSPEYEIVTKEEVPEGAPGPVQAQALNGSTIAVTWRPPKTILQNGRLRGYKVYYLEVTYECKAEPERWEKMIEMDISGGDTMDAIITKWVTPNTLFKIQVAAETSVGIGPKSLHICVKTPEQRPTAPQMTVNMDKTDNVVTIKWWPPPAGKVTGYQIVYGKTLKKFDSLVNVKTKEVSANVRMSVFDDLDAGVYYSFKLYAKLAENKGITAPNTYWLKTSDGLPQGPPLYFTATAESSSSIKLKWEEPDAWLRNGRIVGYDIMYKRVLKDIKWARKRYNLRGEEDSIIYILQDLKSNTEYAIKIKALTVVGPGKGTQELKIKTNKEVLPVVHLLRAEEIESSSTLILWDEPKKADKFKEFTMKYLINLYSNHTYRTNTGAHGRKFTNKTETVRMARQFYLDKLTPGTNYHVTVRVDLQDAGIGDAVAVSFTTKPEKPKLVIAPTFDMAKEIKDYIPLNIPAVSEAHGPISRCLLVVVSFTSSEMPAGLTTDRFIYNGMNSFRRRRRDTALPDSYVAGSFRNEDLPTVYKLGDGRQNGDIVNQPLEKGKYYTTFTRAFVVVKTNPYLEVSTDSNFTNPIQYNPTDIGVTKANTGSEKAGGGMMTIIIAAVAAVLVIVLVVIILVFIIRRRKRFGSETDHLLSRKRKGSTDPTDLHRLQSNAPGMIQHPPIPIELLAQYVEGLRANNGAKLLKEFESIDPERQPSSASLLPQNKIKNRYPNVLAYDDTRVYLDHNGVLCSDYINANYVDGYCQEKAYISTQGPLKNTVDDFWRLCWEQNVQTIVMLTRLEERGRNKCEQYWPSSGSETYDNIKVTIKEEKTYCHYCIRAFEVCSNVTNDTRIMKHFQYLQWPDPGVPLNFGPVLAFVRRVRAFAPPGCGPTVVHCSAGIGRSACFIAIDAMLERLKFDSMVDVYGYVTMMRTQRNFMVQTDEQYIFIYDILVEAIQHANTEIASTELAAVFKTWTELQPNGSEPILERQFNSIVAASDYYDANAFAHANQSANSNKNRCRTIIPFDNNRVVLQPIYGHDGSDYINASFVDGFYRKGAFIATQGPLESTVADFWRMVVEQEISIIVMLCNLEEQGKQQCAQYWPSTKTMRHYYYMIDPIQEKRFANFILREFKVTDARDSQSRVVRHYHYHNWNPSSVPATSEGVLELIGQVQKAHQKSETMGPIIVHGSTGSGRVGVYLALSIALESLRAERLVDIYQIVKTLRRERPYMVQTLDQYEFCYRVACDFLKNFDFVV